MLPENSDSVCCGDDFSMQHKTITVNSIDLRGREHLKLC